MSFRATDDKQAKVAPDFGSILSFSLGCHYVSSAHKGPMGEGCREHQNMDKTLYFIV